MKWLFVIVTTFGLNQSAFALDEFQKLNIRGAGSSIRMATNLIGHSQTLLKDGDVPKICLSLGMAISSIEAASWNLEVLLDASVQGGIAESMIVDIRSAEQAVKEIKAKVISSLGICGGGFLRWETDEKLSMGEIEEQLRQARILGLNTVEVFSKKVVEPNR